ncbi:sigma-70 family RNA polymerase sigma factor [Luteolibacter flavescens]|uniref:Sigma-70 family RNA polymerase sigma factor n=1 Tax=Luteolibacter flavescens TaxID=1859460 RepID=A0ABT3FPP7_9BACT|nr:sigma-70 family RNA polymerase sigma factor [Luteolibacter flavescens]MCW1885548.1 sigma-70 family RNA polymerase sigma factor [Luteolibacter flavescens]
MDTSEHQRKFAEWTGEHGAILHHVVNGFASGADRHDLRQEVMLAVWKSIPAYRGQAKPTTYLYRVCHNAALMWKRSEKNYRHRIDRFTAETREDAGMAIPPAVHRGSGAEERLELLYAAIHRLKLLDRSLILMWLDGLSYHEMAEILGLTEGNVGIKINRIKGQLTQTLKGNDHGPR